MQGFGFRATGVQFSLGLRLTGCGPRETASPILTSSIQTGTKRGTRVSAFRLKLDYKYIEI